MPVGPKKRKASVREEADFASDCNLLSDFNSRFARELFQTGHTADTRNTIAILVPLCWSLWSRDMNGCLVCQASHAWLFVSLSLSSSPSLLLVYANTAIPLCSLFSCRRHIFYYRSQTLPRL